MSISEILIPFSLPPTELAKDLLPALTSKSGTGGLAMLLSRYQSSVKTLYENLSPHLPHEIWFDNYLTKQLHTSLVQYYAQSLQVQLAVGYWFLLNPIHLHIARTHLVLTDYRQLALSESDSKLLFEIAKAICSDYGIELIYGNAVTWFLRQDDWADFVTATPDAACGHNIETWPIKGMKELHWRKLQTEIQMAWFIQPLQQQREEHNQNVVNSLWLWAGAWIRNNEQSKSLILITKDAKFGRDASLSPPLVLLDQLTSAALSNDWDDWLTSMSELETHWFKPLCQALRKRPYQLTHCRLHLSNTNTLLSVQTNSRALKKFWRVANFNSLVN